MSEKKTKAPEGPEMQGAEAVLASQGKIEKSVIIKDTVYEIVITNNRLELTRTVYPLRYYSNHYEDTVEIDLHYSKAWASINIYHLNYGWARLGRSMTDTWSEKLGYIRKSEAKEILEHAREKLREVEDGTPEVLELFKELIEIIDRNVSSTLYEEFFEIY